MSDRIRSLFRRCSQSRNPVLAFAKAAAKVHYLAGQNRSQLFMLGNALHEQMHMLTAQRFGRTDLAAEHANTRDSELRYFAARVAHMNALAAAPLFREALPPADDVVLNDGPQSECGDSNCQGCLACSGDDTNAWGFYGTHETDAGGL